MFYVPVTSTFKNVASYWIGFIHREREKKTYFVYAGQSLFLVLQKKKKKKEKYSKLFKASNITHVNSLS